MEVDGGCAQPCGGGAAARTEAESLAHSEERALISVTAQLLSGDEAVLRLPATATLRELRLLIEAALAVPACRQELVLGGCLLEPFDALLGDAGVEGSTITVVKVIGYTEGYFKEVSISPKVNMTVPSHMDLVKKLGSGAFGTTASFHDR